MFNKVMGKTVLTREGPDRGRFPGNFRMGTSVREGFPRTRCRRTCWAGPQSLVTPPGARAGSHLWARRPASSAAAVGMETSGPRTGSSLAAATAVCHSVSYRAEPLRLSSRDELAEMAASSQGKGGRAHPQTPRGAAFLGPGRGRAARRRVSAQLPPESRPQAAGEGARDSPLARPPPGSGQGQAPGWDRTAPSRCLRLGSLSLPAPEAGDIPSLFSEALWRFRTEAAALSLCTFVLSTWQASFCA